MQEREQTEPRENINHPLCVISEPRKKRQEMNCPSSFLMDYRTQDF